MEKVSTKKEKVQSVIIIILSVIIVIGLTFIVPELQSCSSNAAVEKEIEAISMKEFKTLLNGEEPSLIYVASPTCSHCANQKPIMKKLLNEYGVAVNYINVSALSEEESNELYDVYGTIQEERYQQEGVRTPTIFIVQKGKVLDLNLGEITLNNLLTFISEYIQVGE